MSQTSFSLMCVRLTAKRYDNTTHIKTFSDDYIKCYKRNRLGQWNGKVMQGPLYNSMIKKYVFKDKNYGERLIYDFDEIEFSIAISKLK